MGVTSLNATLPIPCSSGMFFHLHPRLVDINTTKTSYGIRTLKALTPVPVGPLPVFCLLFDKGKMFRLRRAFMTAY